MPIEPHVDLKRAREFLDKKGINALVASTHPNFYYLTGYKARYGERPVIAILPDYSHGAPVILIASHVEKWALHRTYIEEIRTYPIWVCRVDIDDVIMGKAAASNPPQQFSQEYVFEILADILKEKGLEDSTIAIEQNLFRPPASTVLSSKVPKARLIEGESAFWELRKVKTEDEIKALRLSVELGEKGIEALVQGDVLGSTISDLHRKFKMGVLQATVGLDPLDLDFLHAVISSGDPNDLELWEHQVSKGDIVFMDVGVQVFGYNSDMGRTAVVGKPNDLQRKIYEALKMGYEAGLARLRPGIKMKEIYRVIHETVHKNGLDWFARGHTGHMLGIGVGQGWIEQPPWVSANEETELEPNMVMTLEVGTYIDRFGAFQIEDNILITPDGYELLTKLPRDMIEI